MQLRVCIEGSQSGGTNWLRGARAKVAEDELGAAGNRAGFMEVDEAPHGPSWSCVNKAQIIL